MATKKLDKGKPVAKIAEVKKPAAKRKPVRDKGAPAKYPRHAVEKALRIPKAILEQNAGRACTVKEAAAFLGVGEAGPFQTEVSSGIKYGFLDRPIAGQVQVTDRAKQILRPQDPEDRLLGIRDAVLSSPIISDVYGHYRGEYMPESQFFHNALTDTFGVPADKVDEFQDVFLESLRSAELIAETDGKFRLLDVASSHDKQPGNTATFKKLDKAVKVESGDSCFVMMPFASPLGDYYSKVYKPAIEKAGLRPVRADAEIFATGKIMDQIWSGIHAAKVLVAELTSRNPNVFYELDLAHALEKPVVLICGNEMDVPFDLKHIRVIYYDTSDPFWGNKLMDKVAENILSAIANPQEAVLRRNAQ
ncbi:hypothetical protein [Lysobacter sp. H21R4]|uniref:hypothetical protein n=1 Tax=Lysobacter sp. H21R4 TaxID=2781021 RepID=UPI001E40A732|nr:hypothetical protein [Lysobacter sp. H21R4]